MNGTWADTLTPAEVTNALWNGLTSGSGNAISGSSLTLSLCNQNFIYSTVSGSYNPANGSYVLNASNPSPGTYVCSGHQFNTINLSSAGNLLSASGGNQAGQCGSGTGVFTGTSQVSERLTTERIPAGESSAGPPAAMWGDAYGYPTSGIFNMTLTSPSGSAYNFGGRWVQEQNPAPGDPTVPTSYTGTDGCYWPNGPWKTQITKLAQPNSPWNVQSSSSGGTYGPDYIGILSPEIVAIVQAGNPTVSAGGSCTIQYPQKMVINQESVIQPNPATLTEPYGSAGSGVNLLQLTVSPTSVTVGRGNVTEIRTFHF
jgi:hypothetical protein